MENISAYERNVLAFNCKSSKNKMESSVRIRMNTTCINKTKRRYKILVSGYQEILVNHKIPNNELLCSSKHMPL